MIVNELLQSNFENIEICPWIVKRPENEALEKLLSAINIYISKAKIFEST